MEEKYCKQNKEEEETVETHEAQRAKRSSKFVFNAEKRGKYYEVLFGKNKKKINKEIMKLQI